MLFSSNTTLPDLSSETKNQKPQKLLSRRKLFNLTPLDDKILHQLDDLKLGYIARRKARVAVARRYDSKEAIQGNVDRKTEERANKIPFPFQSRRKGSLVISANTPHDIPLYFHQSVPEVAIIGRSNVGKSSILNALLEYNSSYIQKATVTNKPGETKQINFYKVGTVRVPISEMKIDVNTLALDTMNQTKYTKHGKTLDHTTRPGLVIADMPGYGFAFMNENDKTRCDQLCNYYLNESSFPYPDDDIKKPKRSALKRVLLLLDARHGIKQADIQYFQSLFEGGINDVPVSNINNSNKSQKGKFLVSWKLQIVLTKCDLLERNELCRRMVIIQKAMEDALLPYVPRDKILPMIPTSSKENKGILLLQKELAALLPKKPINILNNSTNTNRKLRNELTLNERKSQILREDKIPIRSKNNFAKRLGFTESSSKVTIKNKSNHDDNESKFKNLSNRRLGFTESSSNVMIENKSNRDDNESKFKNRSSRRRLGFTENSSNVMIENKSNHDDNENKFKNRSNRRRLGFTENSSKVTIKNKSNRDDNENKVKNRSSRKSGRHDIK
eukprot:gene5127-7143_t